MPCSWKTATNAEEIHALLCACDAYTATPVAPPPTRSRETTVRRVTEGVVQVLRCNSFAVATFTLTRDPPFVEPSYHYPPARAPMYVGRLAVHPDWLRRGGLVGAQSLRRAIELATSAGADVLRSEANPDLTATRALLHQFGFKEYGGATDGTGRRRVYLQKELDNTGT
jgi:hypothetical protein